MKKGRLVLALTLLATFTGCEARCTGGKLVFLGPIGDCRETCRRDLEQCRESLGDPNDQEGLNYCQREYNECISECENPSDQEKN
jgi:hypothetical protein